ncbi:hypothetical protein [Dactylosporangium aurantiacum]|uniref:hypothetical protein n=1 Tax=Dactylosporangium aurantiacum TaxID=35754 RepID=UPI0005263B6D|nr:hypothetical protein [Dactylosporangium aurantiacum]
MAASSTGGLPGDRVLDDSLLDGLGLLGSHGLLDGLGLLGRRGFLSLGFGGGLVLCDLRCDPLDGSVLDGRPPRRPGP